MDDEGGGTTKGSGVIFGHTTNDLVKRMTENDSRPLPRDQWH